MLSTLISNPSDLIILLLVIAVLVLAIMYYRLHMKIQRFLVPIDAENIGESLNSVSTDLSELQRFKREIEVYLADVEKRLKKSVQSVHTVRFNPFTGTGDGGKQSFATAFLTEDGEGIVISTLYSRDHVSVFGKPVSNYTSMHNLSDEEKEALEQAKVKLK